jgi:hypothetical protein
MSSSGFWGGPPALGAQLSFAEDWYWATERRLDLNWTPVPSADGDFAGEVERMLENDFAKLRLMEPGESDARRASVIPPPAFQRWGYRRPLAAVTRRDQRMVVGRPPSTLPLWPLGG